jgi:hypothetical protein
MSKQTRSWSRSAVRVRSSALKKCQFAGKTYTARHGSGRLPAQLTATRTATRLAQGTLQGVLEGITLKDARSICSGGARLAFEAAADELWRLLATRKTIALEQQRFGTSSKWPRAQGSVWPELPADPSSLSKAAPSPRRCILATLSAAKPRSAKGYSSGGVLG